MSGRSPVYGDCYARSYDSATKTHFNASGEEIPDQFAGKSEDEGRRLHDLRKKDENISNSKQLEIENEEATRRSNQQMAEKKATLKRQADILASGLKAAGVGPDEINRQVEALKAGTILDESTTEMTGDAVETEVPKPPSSNKPRPSDSLGAAAWDIDNSPTMEEKQVVLKALNHTTLCNLCMSLSLTPASGPASMAKNVTAILARIDTGK